MMNEAGTTITAPEQAQRTPIQYWDLWIPDAASCGISFARGRLDATGRFFTHASPPKLRVQCYNHR